MNTVVKVVLGIVVLLGVVCLAGLAVFYGVIRVGGGVIDTIAVEEPAQVTSSAAKIADFTLPEGYAPEYTADVLGVTVASYENGDGHSHLIFAQGPKGLAIDEETLGRMINDNTPNRQVRNGRDNAKVTETRPATIRGQEVTLVFSEGTNSEDQSFSQVTAFFQGKNGPAMVSLEEPSTRWDEAKVMEFIESIE